PSCTEALAWLGADVVKIENPGSGGPGALDRPHHAGCRRALFSAVQLTEAFGCDQPEGSAWARAPQAPRQCADVMIENFAPGAIERLGLGYEAIKAVNPAIITARSRVSVPAARSRSTSPST